MEQEQGDQPNNFDGPQPPHDFINFHNTTINSYGPWNMKTHGDFRFNQVASYGGNQNFNHVSKPGDVDSHGNRMVYYDHDYQPQEQPGFPQHAGNGDVGGQASDTMNFNFYDSNEPANEHPSLDYIPRASGGFVTGNARGQLNGTDYEYPGVQMPDGLQYIAAAPHYSDAQSNTQPQASVLDSAEFPPNNFISSNGNQSHALQHDQPQQPHDFGFQTLPPSIPQANQHLEYQQYAQNRLQASAPSSPLVGPAGQQHQHYDHEWFAPEKVDSSPDGERNVRSTGYHQRFISARGVDGMDTNFQPQAGIAQIHSAAANAKSLFGSTKCDEEVFALAAGALPPLLNINVNQVIAAIAVGQGSRIPAEGMHYTMDSAQKAEYRRVPLDVPNDDWEVVDEDPAKQVRALMAAFRQPFKAELDAKKVKAKKGSADDGKMMELTDEDKAEWLRFQQNHAEQVKGIIESDNPVLEHVLEMRCWSFYRVLKETHEHGYNLTSSSPNQKLKLSERIELCVEVLSQLPIVQCDVLDGKKLFELAVNPDAEKARKLINQWGNWQKELQKKRAAEAIRAAALAAGEDLPSASEDTAVKSKGGRSGKPARGFSAMENRLMTQEEKKTLTKAQKAAEKQAVELSDVTKNETDAEVNEESIADKGDDGASDVYELTTMGVVAAMSSGGDGVPGKAGLKRKDHGGGDTENGGVGLASSGPSKKKSKSKN